MPSSNSHAPDAQIGDCFRPLLRLWPDMRTLAADLELSYFTVAAWVRRDSVPPWRWDALIASARRRRLRGVTFVSLRARAAQRLALDNNSSDALPDALQWQKTSIKSRSNDLGNDLAIAHDAQPNPRTSSPTSNRKQSHAA